jgi:hypothetical protein
VKPPGGKGFALLAALLLCGCSTFNRDWNEAAKQPTPPDSIVGRWEGHWRSDDNGHSGRLRCLMSAETNGICQARFRATYGKIFHFGYTVPLEIHPHFGGWEINGEANLGALGGVYYCEGRVSPTNFFSTYRSKYDHGIFEMQRPK